MRRWLPLLIVAAACVPSSTVVVGETPEPLVPEPPPPPEIVVLIQDDVGLPLAGAAVTFTRGEGDLVDAIAGPDGLAALIWPESPVTVSAIAEGFELTSRDFALRPEETEPLPLIPVRLTGQVKDASGRNLPGTAVTLGAAEALTDADGIFELVRAIPGDVAFSRPGWEDASLEWDGTSGTIFAEMEPKIVRGLHVSGPAVASPEEWSELLDIAETTIVNSLVVDIKDESGRVFYASSVPLASQVDATVDFYDIDDVVAEVKDRGLYLIGRIVSFQDPIAARSVGDLAVWDTASNRPYSKNGQYFLDPTDPSARAYALDLADEACSAGFDEIQFDYVRYPDGYSSSARFDGGSSEEIRVETIRSFLAEASALLNPMGCAVAADVFGFTTSIDDDGGLGQNFSELSMVADVLSPMVYPDHYSTGWFGYNVPNDHPGPVVSNALEDGLERATGPVIVRPWLQDFYYSADQVRAEIDAAEELSLGWMLWNARSRFSTDALVDP